MGKLQRWDYEIEQGSVPDGILFEVVFKQDVRSGEWVKHSDVAELEAENEPLRAENERLRSENERLKRQSLGGAVKMNVARGYIDTAARSLARDAYNNADVSKLMEAITEIELARDRLLGRYPN